MDFPQAFERLKAGAKIVRKRWDGRGLFVFLRSDSQVRAQHPQLEVRDDEEVLKGYVYMCTADGWVIPWVPSPYDVLADDWEEA